MIAVEEAKELVELNTKALGSISIELTDSLGYTLSEDVIASISLPPFHQSAMDGYAIGLFKDGTPSNKFKLIGEVKAGDSASIYLKEGEAVRIFTGAMVPEGTMSVIMQEVVEVIANEIQINQEIKAGINIRPTGEQIKAGELALAKGTVLSPAGIGFLNGFGISALKVHSKPKVGLIVTGNELIKAGQVLKPGQIYESNSATLATALQSSDYHVSKIVIVEDNLESTVQLIKAMIESMDVIILSGGISVGDYDFVGKALSILNVEEIFYKVKQKPGKPLYYGKKGSCNIFALPGNPAAALLCYYQYVLYALRKMSGEPSCSLEKRTLVSQNDYLKKGDRAHFLKALAKDGYVELLDGQSSAMLHTFAVANAVVYIPENKSGIKKGEQVEVQMLP